jgi:stage III sporulation protein AB
MLSGILGGALVMGAATYLGWNLAGRLSRRPAELRALQTGLAVLQSEIEWGATPLPAALRSAAAAAEGRIRELLAEGSARLEGEGALLPPEALRSAIASRGPWTSLTATDLAILGALAPILGATGRHDQSRHLALARERLVGAEAGARAELERYERLARWGPVLVGAAIVLILI